jgi:cytochrome c5
VATVALLALAAASALRSATALAKPASHANASTAVRTAMPARAAHAATMLHLYPNEFPPGGGAEIAGRACALCHSPTLVTQQRKDSLGWEKTLALMEKWGAPVTPAEHDSLRGYLLTRFGPRTR